MADMGFQNSHESYPRHINTLAMFNQIQPYLRPHWSLTFCWINRFITRTRHDQQITDSTVMWFPVDGLCFHLCLCESEHLLIASSSPSELEAYETTYKTTYETTCAGSFYIARASSIRKTLRVNSPKLADSVRRNWRILEDREKAADILSTSKLQNHRFNGLV